MKVKCIQKYQDLQLNKLIDVGDELEVADARGAILINAKVAEAITTPPTPEKVVKAKKPRAKKEA